MRHPQFATIPAPAPAEPAPKPDLDGLLRTMVQSLKQEARRPRKGAGGRDDFREAYERGVRDGETLQARWVLDTLGIAYDG